MTQPHIRVSLRSYLSYGVITQHCSKGEDIKIPSIWHTNSLTRFLIVYFSFSCSKTSYVINTGFLQGHSWSGVSLHHRNRLMSISTWRVMVLIREWKFHGRCIGTCVRLLQWWLGRKLVGMVMSIILQRRGMIRNLMIFFLYCSGDGSSVSSQG
jgi:hypothetical protein